MKIVFPQAVRIITPALLNQGIYILKMSSLISVIGLGDLTRRANELIVTTYRPLEIYSFLVLEYLILVIFASYLVRRIEKKFQIK
jgi:polar amino acid transport system permease protein